MHLGKHVWLIVLGAVVLGLLLPGPGLALKPHVSVLLLALMTLSLLSITLHDVRNAFQHKQVYMTVAISLLATPALAFFAKPLLTPAAFAGLLLAAAVPSGVAIVFLTRLVKGKTSQALSITTLAHLVSIATVPCILYIGLREIVSVDVWSVALALVKFIIVPLILAQLVRAFVPQKIVLPTSTALLVLIIWGLVAPTRELIMIDPWQFGTLAAITIVLMGAAFSIGWLIGKTRQEKATYSISASYKNYTLATVIALSVFGEHAALAAVAYAILNNILFAIAQFLSK